MTTRRLDQKNLLRAPLQLPAVGGLRASAHVFEPQQILAVNTALACRRPLLVRGEPGAGKSQLARAAAVALGRVFVSRFVDVRTEAHDLLWFQDSVARLADAQVSAGTGATAERLARANYVVPGPLWWALDWAGALAHTQTPGVIRALAPAYVKPADPGNGVVLLIDELDKADNSVPNGLLEVLGQGTFAVPGFDAAVHASGPDPLVMLTTNEERALPDAFIRRCVVLHLRVPDPNPARGHTEQTLLAWLVERGRAHFGARIGDDVLDRAAKQLVEDRRRVRAAGFCPPGLAEYIDLLNAVTDAGVEGAAERVAQLAPFVLRKHVEFEA